MPRRRDRHRLRDPGRRLSRVTRAAATFRAGVDLVNFGVVVTDKQGAPITG